MKTRIALVLLAAICVSVVVPLIRTRADEPARLQTFEYATIRWGGRDNTHVIRPGGKVEFAGPQLASIKKPDRVDDRSFYMNIVMNALAKEGYEFAVMTSDEIVMKRSVAR